MSTRKLLAQGITNPSGIDVRGTMMTALDKDEVDRIHETAPDLLQAIFEAIHILNSSLEELEFDLRDSDCDPLSSR